MTATALNAKVLESCYGNFGCGSYNIPEVCNIVTRNGDITPSQVRYLLTDTQLLPPAQTYDMAWVGVPKMRVINFKDLVTLEIIRRLRAKGTSLADIRKAHTKLRHDNPEIVWPFAHESFFDTDSGGNSSDIAEGLTFGPSGYPNHWQLTKLVEIDPERATGKPVIAGTRCPAMVVAAMVKAEQRSSSPAEAAQIVADDMRLTVEEAKEATDFCANMNLR